jgi:hypothetical protein
MCNAIVPQHYLANFGMVFIPVRDVRKLGVTIRLQRDYNGSLNLLGAIIPGHVDVTYKTNEAMLYFDDKGHTFEAFLGKLLPFSEKCSILPVWARLQKVELGAQ